MEIPYSTDATALASAITDAIDDNAYVTITDLPAGLASEPPLDRIHLFDWGQTIELHISEDLRAQQVTGALARACGGSPQPGDFRLVGIFGRTDDGLMEAVGLIQDLASDTATASASVVSGARRRGARNRAEQDRATPAQADEARAIPVRAERVPAALTDLDEVMAATPEITIPSGAEMAATLSLSVKGQQEALSVVAEAVVGHLHKVDPARPLRLLLVGPSGVGKGETYEALASLLPTFSNNGTDWQTVRLDGNQLSEPSSVSELFGASPGYVGHGNGSSLVQSLVASPNTLILIDEIDKAAPAVITAMMGMMDHGFLQLRQPVQGRWTLDCRKAIMLFTSNAGAAELVDRLERSDLSGHRLEAMARQVLIAGGMPEWIAGRHGHIAVYRNLPPAALAEIAILEVARLATEFDLELSWVEPEIVALLLRESNASSTGARAVRAITDRLIGPALTTHCAMLAAKASEQPQPDRLVVVAGPEPHCIPYQTWFAEDLAALTGPDDDPLLNPIE